MHPLNEPIRFAQEVDMTDKSGGPSVPAFLAEALRNRLINFHEHQKLIGFHRQLVSESRETVSASVDPASSIAQGTPASSPKSPNGRISTCATASAGSASHTSSSGNSPNRGCGAETYVATTFACTRAQADS